MIELLKVGHCFHPEAVVNRGHSWRAAIFPAIVGLISHPSKGYILFDTGYAPRFNEATQGFPQRLYRIVTPMHLRQDEQLTKQLAIKQIDPLDIRAIFISHFHADHIAGLIDFPNALFICSRKALTGFQSRQGIRGLIKGYLPALLPDDFNKRVLFIEDTLALNLAASYHPFSHGYDIFSDGSCIAIELPGHADGHYGLLIPQEQQQVMFLVADACWTESAYKQGTRPHPIAKIIMNNHSDYLETLDKLSQLYGNNHSIQIVPSHCKITYERFHSK